MATVEAMVITNRQLGEGAVSNVSSIFSVVTGLIVEELLVLSFIGNIGLIMKLLIN